MMNQALEITRSTQRRGLIAEFSDAFPKVLGLRFWPRLRRIAAILLLLAVFRSVVADFSVVPSASMIPTLLVGDRVLVNKLAYDLKLPFSTVALVQWANPRRGDVIVCFSPTTGVRLVKRVIAIPGDVVELRDNVLYLNGIASRYRPVSSPMGHSAGDLLFEANADCGVDHLILETPSLPARRSFAPTFVPPGKYFAMGDNRDDSFDSRYFGFIDRSQIVGRADRVLISLDDDCLPRRGRICVAIR
jgi:signal peptidase I